MVVEATDLMSEIRAVIQNCDLPQPSCDPIVETVPIRTQWSVPLPDLTGGPEPGGKRYTVLVTADPQASAESASTTLEFDVYRQDPDLDETDSVRSYFSLTQPTEFNLDDDGLYQMIFTGLLNFVEPIQTHLLINTIGGPDDVCTLVP